jgi:transcriptional regulator with XRE-family HTH domain
MNTIGSRLRIARENTKLTIPEVSQKSGISTGNLSKLENDVNKPSSDALISLSNIYDVSIDWILKGYNNKTNPSFEKLLILETPDVEVKKILKKLSSLWHKKDRDIQGWIKIQLMRAFPEIAEEIKKDNEKEETSG